MILLNLTRSWLILGAFLAAGCGETAAEHDASIPDAREKDGARQDGPKKDRATVKKDKSVPKKDTTKPKKDAAAPKKDTAIPKPDMAPPKPDKAAPKPDMASPKPDMASPKPDMASPKPDMAPPKPDMAPPEPDKALPPPDQALPPPDQPTPDQPPPQPDLPTPTPDQALPSPDGPPPVSYSGSFPKGKTGYLSATLTVGGYSRAVRLYLPKGLPSSPPVMLTFHGTNGDAKGFIGSSYAKDLAELKKVLIISPEARKPGVADWDHKYSNEKYWQTYPKTTPATNPDLLLVQAIIQEAKKAYSADPARIYALGHSSGGFFATLAAMTLATHIAGFAASSAGLTPCTYMWDCTFKGKGSANTCAALSSQAGYAGCQCTGAQKPGPVRTSSPKPPGYLFHHTKDPQVSSALTCSLEARLKSQGYNYKTQLLADPYHAMPYNFAVNAWSYLSQFKLSP